MRLALDSFDYRQSSCMSVAVLLGFASGQKRVAQLEKEDGPDSTPGEETKPETVTFNSRLCSITFLLATCLIQDSCNRHSPGGNSSFCTRVHNRSRRQDMTRVVDGGGTDYIRQFSTIDACNEPRVRKVASKASNCLRLLSSVHALADSTLPRYFCTALNITRDNV